MEWLWFILGVAGLGLIWLLIVAMDKLSLRLKEHDEARKLAAKDIRERTEEAEEQFLEEQYIKAEAKDFIENADFDESPEQKEILKKAINALTPDELVQSVTRRVFSNREGNGAITADESALDHLGTKKVVAKSEGITPVKVKKSEKNGLSKAEQKMLKKIKQGD